MHSDTKAYNKAQQPSDRAICQLLAEHIDRNLPEAENRVWHGRICPEFRGKRETA